MERVHIAGAGGFGREIFTYLRDMQSAGSRFEVIGFLDDNPEASERHRGFPPVVSTIDGFVPGRDDRVVLAVGDPALRRQLCEKLSDRDTTFMSVIHPQACLAPDVELGEGCLIAPFTVVGPGATLGRHVMLNYFSAVGHDSVIGQFSVLCPHAVVNGNVQIGDQVFLGTNAAVVAGRSVGSFSKVSAGSVALRNVAPGSLVVGNPGRGRVIYDVSADENKPT